MVSAIRATSLLLPFITIIILTSTIPPSLQTCVSRTKGQTTCDNLHDLSNDANLMPSITLEGLTKDVCYDVNASPNKDARNSVTYLQIQYSIKEMTSTCVRRFPNLVSLYLYDNDIGEIQDDYFSNLESLETLDVADNKIRWIERGAFKNLRNLTELRLSGNRIAKLRSRVFDHLLIESLLVGNNEVEEIEPSALAGMSRLSVISLTNNKLTTFLADDILGRYTHNITHLLLGQNNIDQVTSDMLRGLSQLYSLQLHQNVITAIGPRSFAETPRLKYLQLHGNLLTRLDANVLPARGGMGNLTLLTLSDNRLTFLSYPFVVNLPVLTDVSLGGNPWECACLNSMFQWLYEKKVEVVCSNTYFEGKRPICVSKYTGKAGLTRSLTYDSELYDIYAPETAT